MTDEPVIKARQDWVWSRFEDGMLAYRLGYNQSICKGDWIYIIMCHQDSYGRETYACYAGNKTKRDERGSDNGHFLARELSSIAEAERMAIDHFVRESNPSLQVMK